MDALQLGVALLLADLELAAGEDLEDDVLQRRVLAKGLGEVGGRGGLAARDVEEDVGDLQDVVDVFLVAGPPFEDFVLVARDFEALLGLFVAHEGDVGELYLVGGLVYERHSGGLDCFEGGGVCFGMEMGVVDFMIVDGLEVFSLSLFFSRLTFLTSPR